MKIQELHQPSVKLVTNNLLDKLRKQARAEAEQMMDQYEKDLEVNPHTLHPSQIIDQQLDKLFHATIAGPRPGMSRMVTTLPSSPRYMRNEHGLNRKVSNHM